VVYLKYCDSAPGDSFRQNLHPAAFLPIHPARSFQGGATLVGLYGLNLYWEQFSLKFFVMLFIKAYYYIFSGFIYLVAGFCEAAHAVKAGKLSFNLKQSEPLKTHLLPGIHLRTQAGHV
jgi:hypothetical protein